ncbi:MAG: Hpt domain-containing protein [Novosphingobium sp.]|nr:Hpt domain-containing protein [Novosphingobium sp.]
MAFEFGALDATLAAAAGNDPELLAELRNAFRDSLVHQVDLLGRARCDGNWNVAAMRLKGLAASFQAGPLMDLAEEALDAAPGDPVVLRKFRAALDEFAAG